MAEYLSIETSPEVYAVLRARHGKDMEVYATFSDPTGEFMGNAGQGRMNTIWSLQGVPLLEAKTVWDINPEKTYERLNEQHFYWLCVTPQSE